MKIRLFILFIIVTLILSFYSYNTYIKNTSPQKLEKNLIVKTPLVPTPKPTKSLVLEKIVLNQIKNESLSNYAIVVENLKTGESYKLNENKKFDTASLYKLWLVGEAYNQINQNKVSENDILSSDIAELNAKHNISSDFAQYSTGFIKETINEAINNSITISNNESALLLSDKIGNNNVKTFIQNNNFNSTSYGGENNYPQTTANDTALFFKKLYSNTLINSKYSNTLLNVLKNQTFNHKIAKYIPNNINIAHKTGELENNSHDAGIVFTEKGDYIIVILTNTMDPKITNDTIAQISKEIYTYFINPKL